MITTTDDTYMTPKLHFPTSKEKLGRDEHRSDFTYHFIVLNLHKRDLWQKQKDSQQQRAAETRQISHGTGIFRNYHLKIAVILCSFLDHLHSPENIQLKCLSIRIKIVFHTTQTLSNQNKTICQESSLCEITAAPVNLTNQLNSQF